MEASHDGQRAVSRRALARPLAFAITGCSFHRAAGTGDLAFRLAWNGMSDLDLFVRDPQGDCLSYFKRTAPSGALLDVDCNAATDRMCARPVENVFWPEGEAPAGEVLVWMHAHTVLAPEAPVAFELRVLRGHRTTWSARLQATQNDQILGPFRYRYPGPTVQAPLPNAPALFDLCPLELHPTAPTTPPAP